MQKVGPPPGSRMTSPGHGTKRRARLLLDPTQYQMDVEKGIADAVYGGFNLILRRRPKENNFKAILHTIRDLMNSPAPVPAWCVREHPQLRNNLLYFDSRFHRVSRLHDVFLGYGDPAAARGVQLQDWIDFRDTFLDYDHLARSFPDLRVVPKTADLALLRPPFQLRFSDGVGIDSDARPFAAQDNILIHFLCSQLKSNPMHRKIVGRILMINQSAMLFLSLRDRFPQFAPQ